MEFERKRGQSPFRIGRDEAIELIERADLTTLGVMAEFWAHRLRIRRSERFEAKA